MNNPAAFPLIETAPDGSQSIEPGMSLRNYFAAKAMQAWLTDAFGDDYAPNEDKCARFAYKMADAMLAEREKGVQK